VLPLLSACIRTFTTSMGFVVAVAHATEMPDTNIGSAKEYAEEEEEEADVEFSRRSRSLLIVFPKWKSHLCCTFTTRVKNARRLDAKSSDDDACFAGEKKKERNVQSVKERERERMNARSVLSLSLFCEEEPPQRGAPGKGTHTETPNIFLWCSVVGGKELEKKKSWHSLSPTLSRAHFYTNSRARLIREKSRERQKASSRVAHASLSFD